MELEQRIEMNEKIRELRRTGNPHPAQLIQTALNEDRYFMGPEAQAKADAPKEPKKTAKKEAWTDYAKAVSQIDEEVIDGATRTDIIGMLEANGLIEKS